MASEITSGDAPREGLLPPFLLPKNPPVIIVMGEVYVGHPLIARVPIKS